MIYVIRHGQTDLNKEGRLQGRMGLPLNETGIKQAETLRTQLNQIKFDHIFSSPQERAVQTAEISTGLKAFIDPRLDVFDLGEADRLKKEEVKLSGVVPDSTTYNGVEDIQKYVKRVYSFMHELEKKYPANNITILISGHKCTTGCIGAYFEGALMDRDILKLSSQNGGYKIYSL